MKNIYQIYHDNDCQLGFFIRRDSWAEWRKAKVTAIEGVTDGQKIKGCSPYYGNPKVTIEAVWIYPKGKEILHVGGNYSFILVEK